jgi:malate synthase
MSKVKALLNYFRSEELVLKEKFTAKKRKVIRSLAPRTRSLEVKRTKASQRLKKIRGVRLRGNCFNFKETVETNRESVNKNNNGHR